MTSRFITSLTAYGAAVLIYANVVLDPLADLPDEEFEEEETTTNKKADIDDDEDDTLFIPLGWPRKVPGEPYAGDDPEWEMFMKVADDRYLLMDLKGM